MTDPKALKTKAAKHARDAEEAQAQLAEAEAQLAEVVALQERERIRRAEEWDREFLRNYDGGQLRQDIGDADEAFRAALLGSDWGAALVAARRAMWVAIHMTSHAESVKQALGAPDQLPVFRYRHPDIARNLETLIDEEAKRQADLELAELYDARERHASGD